MATLNVGAMAARLGLDPAEFLDKMKGVEGFTSGLNQRMSAEMKRTSREGAESFRLIDEALGIHVSRPLTKILTQQFPAFASALQSLLGVGVVGALGAVVVEVAEHISKKMAEATKKEEEYADAVRRTKTVVAEARAESERRLNETLGKDAGVRGDQASEAYYKGLATDAANVAQLAKFTDQLTEALRKQQAAALALMPVWARLADIWKTIWISSSEEEVEKVSKQTIAFREKVAELAYQDAHDHTKNTEKYIAEERLKAQASLDAMQKSAPPVTLPLPPGTRTNVYAAAASPEAIASQKEYLNAIKQIQDQQELNAKVAKADRSLENDTEAKTRTEQVTRGIEKIREAQKRVQDESVRMGKELQTALDKKDEVRLLDDAFKNTLTTLAQYRAIVGGKGFFAEFGVSADELAQKLAVVTAHLESEVQLKKFLEQTHGSQPREFGDTKTPFPLETPAMPTLVHGGAVAGELAAFGEEPRKQIEMMKKAFEEAMTPVQKFTLAQQELDLILKNADGTFRAGAEGAAAYAGAMRHLVDEEIRADAASKKATDGLHGFWLELQQGEKSGKFAFDLGTTMFKDFEDGIAKTILATRSQHAELRRMWEGYFKGLEEMALKFALSKSFASLANLIAPNASGGGSSSAGGGIAGLLGKIFGMGGKTPGTTTNAGIDQATVANTTATTANTTAVNALTSAMQQQSGGGGGGGGLAGMLGGGGGDAGSAVADVGGGLGGAIEGFAEGGDATPGSSFISGEAGAERVDLTRGGGARITPLGSKTGGDTVHNYDMRGAVVTEELLRKAEAAQMMQQSEQRATARAVSMSQEISKRSRPGR